MKSTPAPRETDFAVEVLQGTTKKTWNIKAPTKASAISQAEDILKIQRVKPWKVLGAVPR